MPPSNKVSNSFDPVVNLTIYFLLFIYSFAVVNYIGTILWQTSIILSILASVSPLMFSIFFRAVYKIDSTVLNPASYNFLISLALIPFSSKIAI